MSTYETMKHNIPEGATHYYHNGSSYGWVKKEACATGHDKSFIWDFDKWVRGVVVSYAVKPIPKPTCRYEKVELSPKEVFMAMLNGEEFYVLGDLINFDGEQFWRHTEEGKSRITYINHDHEIHRRIEVTERDLFIEHMKEKYPDVCIGVFEHAYEKIKSMNGKG